jgi:hypothetical protein
VFNNSSQSLDNAAEVTLIHCLLNDLFTFCIRASISDSRNVPVIQFTSLLAKTFSRRPNLRLPAAAHTRQPQNTTAAAFKTFLQRFQNLLPVGYMTTPKDSFPASMFLEATRKFQKILSGGSHDQTHGVSFPSASY